MPDTERTILRLASRGCSPWTIWAALWATDPDVTLDTIAALYNEHAVVIAAMRKVYARGLVCG